MRFFLKEALRSVQRNPIPSFAAMASILVTVLVLGIFIPITQATTGAANEVRDKVLVNVYMKANSSKADQNRVAAKLREDTEYVGKVAFVSKEAAFREQRSDYPEYYSELLGSNPLPDTFRVTPDNPDNALKLRDAIAPATATGARAAIDPAIDTVKNRKDDTQNILFITRVVKWAMALLAGLLIVASVLLISNTIRLSLFARRREVEVMKLVGATDWFIRWPFVIEGVMLGALGGVLAVLSLTVGKLAFIDPLLSDFALLRAPETMQFGLLAIVLLGASVAVSAMGSGLSLRRFLKV